MSKIMQYILDNEIELEPEGYKSYDEYSFLEKAEAIEQENETLKDMIDNRLELDLSECPF